MLYNMFHGKIHRATVTEAQLKEGVLIKRGKKSFNKFILV